MVHNETHVCSSNTACSGELEASSCWGCFTDGRVLLGSGMGAKTIDTVLSACGYGNHGHECVIEKGEVTAKNKPFPGRAVGGI